MNDQSLVSDEPLFFSKARHSLRQQLYAMKLLGQFALGNGASGNEALNKLIKTLEGFEPYLMGILRFVQLENQKISAQKISMQLQDVFQRLNLHCDELIENANVELQIRATDIQLHSDPEMLFELMQPLVLNALKFSRSRVLVAARRRRQFFILEVWDDGCGISDDAMKKIFDPFFSIGPATGSMPGTGLGLPTVRMLAQTLGYELHVDSEVGRGTRFQVKIPIPIEPDEIQTI